MRFIDKTKELWNTEKGNARKNLLKLILAVPFWFILAALVMMAFGIGRTYYLIDTRPDQKNAEIWQNSSDTSFRHMSVYAGGIRADHSSVLAWRIPGMEDPGGLPSMGSHRVRHD